MPAWWDQARRTAPPLPDSRTSHRTLLLPRNRTSHKTPLVFLLLDSNGCRAQRQVQKTNYWRLVPRRTEDKLRNQRAGSGAGHPRRGARAQKVDQQAGERANPGADEGDHEPLGHYYNCSGPIPAALANSTFSYKSASVKRTPTAGRSITSSGRVAPVSSQPPDRKSTRLNS